MCASKWNYETIFKVGFYRRHGSRITGGLQQIVAHQCALSSSSHARSQRIGSCQPACRRAGRAEDW